MAMPAAVTIVEVGPRDGLQNEATLLDTATKVMLVERLVASGTRRIETASFVHPELVPQMADAEAVMTELGASPDGGSYIGLVLNSRGLERPLQTFQRQDDAIKSAQHLLKRLDECSVDRVWELFCFQECFQRFLGLGIRE